jgi:hypothetical protein
MVSCGQHGQIRTLTGEMDGTIARSDIQRERSERHRRRAGLGSAGGSYHGQLAFRDGMLAPRHRLGHQPSGSVANFRAETR